MSDHRNPALRLGLLLAAALCLSAASRAGGLPEPQYTDWSWEKEIFVPMRDGIRLSTDVLLPEGAEGKLPTVLVRTPYHKENTHWALFGPWDTMFLQQGYAVVIMNERGRHFSEGYYEDYLEGARNDGYDSVEWIVNQPWSNGKVGTFGCSSSGEHQWAMASTNHPGHGGCCGDAMALDQSDLEMRSDVLTYTTPVLEEGVTIAGPIDEVLYVSSSAKDTDFMVKLVDVYPDGTAINLIDDAIRARYREGFDKQVFMEPGGVYKVRLTNLVTANRFPAGHRIRIEVASSNFPMLERNLNTGGNNYDETEWVVAENSVHHTPEHPSHIVLPVLPE